MFEADAPDFKDIAAWINSEPLRIPQLRKKVVMLDFWTYSCINCVRTLPHIKILHEKYGDKGLVIIGVHTPEFEFEKNLENVKVAVEKYGLEYPIALDLNNTTWKLYGNQYWPRTTLIDARNKIRLEHVGEGDFDIIEQKIIELLAEIGVKVEEKIERQRIDRFKAFEVAKKQTPEIYLGSERSTGFGNSQVCTPGSCIRFIDRGDHEQNIVYLAGDWEQRPEFIFHPTSEEAHVSLKYTAKSVNAVIAPKKGGRFKVFITLDGKDLDRSIAGRDIKIDKVTKKSFILVDKPDMYELVETETMQTHEIKLISDSPEFSLYTFTFG